MPAVAMEEWLRPMTRIPNAVTQALMVTAVVTAVMAVMAVTNARAA